MKKLLVLLTCCVILLSLSACGSPEEITDAAGDRSVPERRQFTFWIRQGNEHYNDYEKNPGIAYLETLSYGTDEDGNEKYIDLSFFVPVSGAEADNFNTLIATGDYMDVMDLSAYGGKTVELYEDGVLMDITEWVENYMPNYIAYLDTHPEQKATATNNIDGEKRYIQLFIYEDQVPDMWGGYLYRRDWIVKYGAHPVGGSSFSGGWTIFNEDGTHNPDSWVDNVAFPSGGSDPVTISDWEWMFQIFDLALQDLGITDGYGISLYYPGYMATGDLVCAFGGGNPNWYKNADNNIVFGGTSDSFRAYLQAMKTWYANGWLDKAFAEHTGDLFYLTDNTKVFSGKVGVWYGLTAQIGSRLANPEDPYLNGLIAFSASQPINDIYGNESEQNKTPYSMYQTNLESVSYGVTNAATDKDLAALFTFLDYMYDMDGGGMVRSYGLSKEQYEVTRDAFMTENGLTEGAYEAVLGEDGITRYRVLQEVLDKSLGAAIRPERLPGINSANSQLMLPAENEELHIIQRKRWTLYQNTGWLPGSFTGQLSAEDAKTLSKVNTNIGEFMAKYVPGFIKGTKDPYSDEDWNAFVNALNKYNPDQVTVMLQALADELYGE